MSRRRWPVRLEVGLDRTHASFVEVRHTRPTRVVIEALEGGMPLARGTEAHISLPREWLEKGVGLAYEGRTQDAGTGAGR